MVNKKITAVILASLISFSNIFCANVAIAAEYKAMFVPNDEYYEKQPYLELIGAEEAWDQTQGSSEVVIAILDTGVDLNHPDLKPNLVAGWNFIDKNARPQDDNGHGTHVAGVAAAAIDNGVGGAGLAGQAKIMPIKVLDAHGEGDESSISEGIRYAVDQGAKVINLSLGTNTYSKGIEEAVDYAYGQGVLIVAAAGNDDGGPVSYPGKFKNVMAVSAIDEEGNLAAFSNQGPEIEVAAPGTSILNTWWNEDSGYGYVDGTSAAAPLVSGLAALIWSKYPYLYNFQIRQIIQETADDLGPEGIDEVYGHGRINVLAALNSNPAKTFRDIQKHWAQVEIEELATKGIVRGHDGDYFSPQSKVTRAEFATLLIRALELEEDISGAETFTDVPQTKWYYHYVELATEMGFVKGYGDGTFRPDDPITREQMVVMLTRALEIKGIGVTLEPEETNQILKKFVDAANLRDWSRVEFTTAINFGIVKGVTENALRPQDSANRAEAATIIKRTLDTIPSFT